MRSSTEKTTNVPVRICRHCCEPVIWEIYISGYIHEIDKSIFDYPRKERQLRKVAFSYDGPFICAFAWLMQQDIIEIHP